MYLFFGSVFVTGCALEKQKTDGLPFIDVGKTYPEKEISLTDIAEVTYLHLNADREEYLYKGAISNVTQNRIVVYDSSSGSVLFFSKEGAPVSRFNHYGQGPEEYINVQRIIYDEENDDVFVCDNQLKDNKSRILTYSSTGEYKRHFSLPYHAQIHSIVSFDDTSFFVNTIADVEVTPEWDGESDLIPSNYYTTFYQISKTDGAVLDSLQIRNNVAELIHRVNFNGNRITIYAIHFSRIVKAADGFFLCNPESDTIFSFSKEKLLAPVFHKIPPVQSTKPKVVIQNWLATGSYRFFRLFTIHQDFNPRNTGNPYYIFDTTTHDIYRQKIVLPDYQGKTFTLSPDQKSNAFENNGTFIELELIELKEAFRANRLGGKLKELVATLNELEDNNVFVLVSFK